MAIPLDELVAEFSGNPGAAEAKIDTVEKDLKIALPADYVDFLKRFDGGEGFIGEHYLILWKAEELVPFNSGYQVKEYAPGLLIFGSDGGGEGFAYDTRSSPFRVVMVPFIGMSLEDAHVVADNFIRLLERMTETDECLF